jgi:hypothetical protein
LVSIAAVRRGVEHGGNREHALRALQVRPVEHATFVRHDACTCLRGERGDNAVRRRDGCGRRLKNLVQYRHLVGMDGELAGEAVALRRGSRGRESVDIPKRGVHGIDGRHAGCRGCEQA